MKRSAVIFRFDDGSLHHLPQGRGKVVTTYTYTSPWDAWQVHGISGHHRVSMEEDLPKDVQTYLLLLGE